MHLWPLEDRLRQFRGARSEDQQSIYFRKIMFTNPCQAEKAVLAAESLQEATGPALLTSAAAITAMALAAGVIAFYA